MFVYNLTENNEKIDNQKMVCMVFVNGIEQSDGRLQPDCENQQIDNHKMASVIFASGIEHCDGRLQPDFGKPID